MEGWLRVLEPRQHENGSHTGRPGVGSQRPSTVMRAPSQKSLEQGAEACMGKGGEPRMGQVWTSEPE